MLITVCVAAALVWLLVAVVSSFGRDGSGGEGRVARRLAKLPQEDYQTVNDIMLPTVDGETTQVDHVVVSRYGIFVIETKDYNGWIFGGENQRIWTQSFMGGRWSGPQKFHFQNPIRRLHTNHDPVLLAVACERGELRCPKCGAKMVLRHRKSDGAAFYGCSRYPQCRGTRQA